MVLNKQSLKILLLGMGAIFGAHSFMISPIGDTFNDWRIAGIVTVILLIWSNKIG